MNEEGDKSSRVLSAGVPAAGVFIVVGCTVAQIYMADVSGGWVWGCMTVSMMFLTNWLWVGSIPVRGQEQIGFWGMLPWGMNFVMAGAVVVGCVGLFSPIDVETISWVMAVLLATAVGTGFGVRRMPAWKILGMVAVAGGTLTALGVFCLVMGLSFTSSMARNGFLVLSVVLGIPGLLMVVPTAVGAAMMYQWVKKYVDLAFCKACGYDIHVTVAAGGKECPECGAGIYEARPKNIKPRCVRCRRDLADVLEEGGKRCPDCGVLILGKGDGMN
jgi:predicted RNA-binding Zn-ribbon protein involved in translation (DUF1610 family)